MGLKDLTRPAVNAAIAEFDQKGRDTFLREHGFGRSRGYFLVQDGREYDSKAIAGAAHGQLGPEWQPLQAAEFTGGEQSVAQTLRRLGYDVIGPADRRDEVLPFEVGQLYNRQRDIHQRYAGQQQGGISTPLGAPYVFLFTGETGAQYGYSDGWGDDGQFAYTGEGQRGDMQFVRGNKSIRDHLEEGRDLLLFQAQSQRGWYRFWGCFACAGVEARRAPDVDGHDREVLVFLLAPVPDVEQSSSEPPAPTGKPLEELRQLAYAAATAKPSPGREGLRTYRERSAAVRAYVLARAAGVCECCDEAAPFKRQDGSPYLEPHHTRRLADGGPDNPRWVGAICPNCHREIHHGKNGKVLNDQLQCRLKQLEEAAGQALARGSATLAHVDDRTPEAVAPANASKTY